MFQRLLISVILGGTLASPAAASDASAHHQDPAAPRILLDQPLRAVEYQLSRLTDDELTLVERKPDDPRYRPVYFALLVRKGVARQFRDEALAALTKIDKSSPSRVLLEALAKVPPDDNVTAEKLLTLLLVQAEATLQAERAVFMKAVEGSAPPFVLRGAYAATMIGDGKPDQAWKAALAQQGHLQELLRSVPQMTKAENVRRQLFTPVAVLVSDPRSPNRIDALAALGWTRQDGATFDLLAQEVIKGTDADSRAAAIRSLQVIPEGLWPAATLEPLARAIVTAVSKSPTDSRTEPATLDAIQFGEKLAAKLPPDAGRAVRRDLRALGVQVVRIQTIPEQLSFDVKWFPVEAGKPVQIVLFNPDAMPHNLLVGKPGSLKEIGPAGGAVPMPTDPDAKPFVPDSPLVLHASRLLKEGETDRLGFTAPKQPGEYIFVCTFPGHWVRMYGVMLVVENLEAWESKPTVPTDPLTDQPFAPRRN